MKLTEQELRMLLAKACEEIEMMCVSYYDVPQTRKWAKETLEKLRSQCKGSSSI